MFGLEHWAELPEPERITTVRDVRKTVLVGDLGPGPRYRAILAKKSTAERDDIRAALMGSGFATNDVLQALGL
jgi:hypothetical protein